MYQYDQYDQRIVEERSRQFRGQVQRRLSGEILEDEFKPLRLQNGLYMQLHAYMLRVAVPYGLLSSTQMRKLAHIARTYDKGYGHWTTRQNLQLNWIELQETPDILHEFLQTGVHNTFLEDIEMLEGQQRIIDADRPSVEVDVAVEVNNLKDPEAGERQRVDLALERVDDRHERGDRPALALDQDRNAGIRGPAGDRDDLLHAGALGDQVVEGHLAFDLPLQAGDLPLHRGQFQQVLDRHLQAFGAGRLDDEVQRAGAHRLDDGVDAALRREHDHRQVGPVRPDLLQHAHAVEVGHHQIEQHEVDRLAALGIQQDVDAFLAAARGHHAIAGARDQGLEQPALRRIVVDDEDGLGHGAVHA